MVGGKNCHVITDCSIIDLGSIDYCCEKCSQFICFTNSRRHTNQDTEQKREFCHIKVLYCQHIHQCIKSVYTPVTYFKFMGGEKLKSDKSILMIFCFHINISSTFKLQNENQKTKENNKSTKLQ